MKLHLTFGGKRARWNIKFDAFIWREERWNINFDTRFGGRTEVSMSSRESEHAILEIQNSR